jgi:hypothetical protein
MTTLKYELLIEAIKSLPPPSPEIRSSLLVPIGQIYKMPGGYISQLYKEREIWFLNPVDYQRYLEMLK